MNKQRIEYIDLAKGICIFFVLFFHISQLYGFQSHHDSRPIAIAITSINDVIGVFRMPLYFFLSGCFFKSYNGFFDFLKKKTNKLLIPFVFFYIVISFIVPNILSRLGLWVVFYQPLRRIFDAWLFDFYPSVPIWFLLCLFWMGLIFYGIYCLSNKFKHNLLALIIFSLLTGAIGILLGTFEIELPANLDTAMTNIPHYMAGYVIFRKTKLFYPNKFDKYIFLFIPLAIAIDAILLPQSDVFNNHFAHNAWITLYPCGIIGVLAIVLLAKKVQKLPILSYFGRYSIIILVTHFTIIEIMKFLLGHFPISINVQFVINFAITLSSYFLVIPFARKFLPYVTAQKDVLK